MKTLALDIGSTMGYAIRDEFGVSSGTISFKKNGKFSRRGYYQMYTFLFDLLIAESKEDFEIVVEVPHASKFFNAVKILFGLLGVVYMFCNQHSIQLTEYKPTQIKKFATGKGNAKKADMIAAIQKDFPGIKENNQVDALHLLRLHLSKGTK